MFRENAKNIHEKMLKSKNCTRIKVPKGAVLQGFWHFYLGKI